MPPWRVEGLLGGNGPIALPVCLNILIKYEPKGNSAVSLVRFSVICTMETRPLLLNPPNVRPVGGLTTAVAVNYNVSTF